MSRGSELRNCIFREIAAQGGTVIDAAPTRGGHQQVRCNIAGEQIVIIFSTSPSDWRALKSARSYVRRRARAARARRIPNGQ